MGRKSLTLLVQTTFSLFSAVLSATVLYIFENPCPENHKSFLFYKALAIQLDWISWVLGMGAHSGEAWSSTVSGLNYLVWRRAMHNPEIANLYLELDNTLEDSSNFKFLKESLEEILEKYSG